MPDAKSRRATDSGKPLDAKSRSALISELKGVVARAEPDEKNSAAVAKKWDARRDLAGKTKTVVINLLFEDVRSVIKDLGTQYQILSIFSAYKQMPDESFSAQTPSSNGAKTKTEAVEKLIDLTFTSHPYVGIEEQVSKLPGTKSAQEIEEIKQKEKRNRIEGFDAALKVNKSLTPAQKSFVRANYEQLIETMDKITDDAINANFPTEQWIKEGLRQSYTRKFSERELNDLNNYFQAADGQRVLNYIRQRWRSLSTATAARWISPRRIKPNTTNSSPRRPEKNSSPLR